MRDKQDLKNGFEFSGMLSKYVVLKKETGKGNSANGKVMQLKKEIELRTTSLSCSSIFLPTFVG